MPQDGALLSYICRRMESVSSLGWPLGSGWHLSLGPFGTLELSHWTLCFAADGTRLYRLRSNTIFTVRASLLTEPSAN